MNLLRALAMPFQFTSLLLAGVIAAAAALSLAMVPMVGALVILPLSMLFSWLNKYALALLDHAANGVVAAPVASAELLGPFGGLRPLVHVAMGIAIALLLYLGRSPWQPYLGLAVLLLLPASIGAAALHQRALDAIAPRALWRTLRGLGLCYLPLLAAMAACAAGVYLLAVSPLWNVASFLLIALLWLCFHALLGGLLYLRRDALKFEPRVSPEWQAERDALEHERQRQHLIDTVYASIRVRDAARASAALLAWVGATDAGQHLADARAIVAQAAHWPEQRGLRTVARTLCAQFIGKQQLSAALATAEAALAHAADFALDSAADSEALAQYAQACGRTRVAQNLRDNYARALAAESRGQPVRPPPGGNKPA